HMMTVKHVADEAALLAQVKAVALASDESGRVLSPMLQQRQCFVEILIDISFGNNANDTTHNCYPTLMTRSARRRLPAPREEASLGNAEETGSLAGRNPTDPIPG